MDIFNRIISAHRRGNSILQRYRTTFIVTGGFSLALVITGMIAGRISPALHESALASVKRELESYWVGRLVKSAYDNGHVGTATVLTFLVNSTVGSFLTLTLPSLVLPGSTLIMHTYRCVYWGLFTSPSSASKAAKFLPDALILLLEGAAYVIPTGAAYLHAQMVYNPSKFGFLSRKDAYVAGVRMHFDLYPTILSVLAVSALYEAVAIIHIDPWFETVVNSFWIS